MNKNYGFTLLEMLVTLGIMTIIITVILVNFPRFTETMYLYKGAQSVASNIRRAQVYGISVKENPSGSGAFPAYGLYFHFSVVGSESYYLFADVNGDNHYTSGEQLQTHTVPKPGYFFALCVDTNCSIQGAEIIFKRPVPEIYIYGKDPNLGPFDLLELKLQSPRGQSKSVFVYRSGQISVK